MKKTLLICVLSIFSLLSVSGQTLAEAKKLYLAGKYEEALPVFAKEYKTKSNDASTNQWYGVCLYETKEDLNLAEKCLLFASNRRIQDANLYLGLLYTDWFQFDKAETYFDKYKKAVTPKGWRSKVQKEQDAVLQEHLEQEIKKMQRIRRMVGSTEDIQIIDSIIVVKRNFLSAYALSLSGGSVVPFKDVFQSNLNVNSTVYFNEKKTKIYYAQPDTSNIYSIYSMEYLLDKFSNEQVISKDNFELNGSINYPFVMPDGVTVYFAAKDEESLGGYDLFISRYNLNTDTYLKPERLNMPFNSAGNDYMMVIDEEKNVGWFASDRNTEEDQVCIYTFIPNSLVKIIETEDSKYLASRSQIHSIKDSWTENVDYNPIIAKARKKPIIKEERRKDFELVINDKKTYYTLEDFTVKESRDVYYKVIQLRAEFNDICEKLEEQREEYTKANETSKSRFTHSILSMEKRQHLILEELPQLEKQARNIENKALKR